jgi:hypothetical protein
MSARLKRVLAYLIASTVAAKLLPYILPCSPPLLNYYSTGGSHRQTSTVLRHDPESLYQITPLISRQNIYGIYGDITFPGRPGFNPSLLALPFNQTGKTKFVLVARDEIHDTWHDNVPEVRPRSTFAALLDFPPDADVHPNSNFEAYSMSPLELLANSKQNVFENCNTNGLEFWYRNMQGPEDPRIFRSHLGEPLLIYSSIGAANSGLCRQLYIVDLRVVYPALREALESGTESTDPAPLRFNHSVPLLYANQTGLQKNWAPFTNTAGELFIHTDLIPQRIYKLNFPARPLPDFSSLAVDLPLLEPVPCSSVGDNCLVSALTGERGMPPDGPWVPFAIHQSTPFLEVVLCTFAEVLSGVCDEDNSANRLYIGLIHLVHNPMKPKHYERRIVTLRSTSPFEYLSVSKPLMYCISP